jgi:hypothetical protein
MNPKYPAIQSDFLFNLNGLRGFQGRNYKVALTNTNKHAQYNTRNIKRRVIDTLILFYLIIHQLIENKEKYIDNNKVYYKVFLIIYKEDMGDLQGTRGFK